MFVFYGRILAIWWTQRRRIDAEVTDAVRGGSAQTAVQVIGLQPATNAADDDARGDAENDPRTAGNGEPASADQQLQRQQIKSRRREFKAVYLTAAVVGAFVVLWFPHVLGRVLASTGYISPLIVSYIGVAGGAIGTSNFAISWIIYAAVSKSYRRAYRQMLTRIGCCRCENVTSLRSNNSHVV